MWATATPLIIEGTDSGKTSITRSRREITRSGGAHTRATVASRHTKRSFAKIARHRGSRFIRVAARNT
jgi:hypothetical protein